MKLALISHGPPDDPRHFSGIPWHVLQELRRQGHEAAPFHADPADGARRWAKTENLFSLKFTRQPHHPEADSWVLRTRSTRVAAQIRAFSPDAVLCVGFPEAAIALPSSPPIYVWMDALFPSVRRTYSYFGLYYSDRDARRLHRIENEVMQRCQRVWLSSEWAAAEARADFPHVASRLEVQSFGANLPKPPTAADVQAAIPRRNLAEPLLLFLGVEWKRKGGDAAVTTVQRLRANGCPARLAVVGPPKSPPAMPTAPWLEWIGPLDKKNPAEAQRLDSLLSAAAFLLLPSEADCTPIACHEAAAFGLPVLATSVGGLPSTVDTGESGMLWPVEKFADEAPAWIAATCADRPRYEAMARAARRRFEAKGNWAVNVRAIVAAIAANRAGNR